MGSEVSISERAGGLANAVRLAQAESGGGDASAACFSASRESVAGLDAREANEVLREAERLVPGWFGGRVVTGQDGTSDLTAARELRDAEFLATELAGLAGTLDEATRRSLGERLAAAGVAAAGVSEPGAGAAARARGSLGIKEGQEVPVDRLLESLAMLADMVRALDQLAWRTWRQMAPQSEIRRRGELSVLLGRYASGASGAGEEQVAADLAQFRQLIASLLASIGQAGDVAAQRAARLSPLHVENLATAERGVTESVEAACWRKYRELAGQMDEASVQSDTMRAMAAFAEGLMRS
jgi:hypothetical protein